MKKYYFSNYALVFLLISINGLSLYGCKDKEAFTGPAYSTGAFPDNEQQREFLNMLDIENIPYRVLENSSIQFPKEVIAKVFGIKRKILYGSELNSTVEEEVIVIGDFMKEKYEKALKDAEIAFKTDRITGIHDAWAIEYSQHFGPKVDKIRQDLEMKFN